MFLVDDSASRAVCFFLTHLMLKDLSFRFGLSVTQISRYLTTWICFLYEEIDWMPSVEQVMGTMPTGFREKFPTSSIRNHRWSRSFYGNGSYRSAYAVLYLELVRKQHNTVKYSRC